MGKKYIIELEDSESVYKTIIANGYPMLQVIVPAPYTEPDLDAIRNETWEAARKIGSNSMCSLKEMGFDFGQSVVNDYNPSWFVVKNYSASECIEKIRQYEQEKEEIRVGDEVVVNGLRGVVMKLDEKGNVDRYFTSDGKTFGNITGFQNNEVTKTGRHFPEIAEVLAKMRE